MKINMSLRSVFCGCLFLILPGIQAQSQVLRNFYKDIEVYIGTGTANYFGDIGGQGLEDPANTGVILKVLDKLDVDIMQTGMMGVAGVRLTPSKSYALNLQISPLFLRGSDKNSAYQYRYGRNFIFNATAFEINLLGEYYFANRITGTSPYGFAGLGGVFFTGSKNFDIANGHTVPNKIPYVHYQSSGVSVIFGFGTRFPAKNQYSSSLDFSFHYTSDLLDGYKTNSKSPDLFFVLSYKLNIELATKWYYDHKGLVR
jgi:hypothetical protein